MKLKELLLEAVRDKLALEFLSNLVKKGPFANKVFLAGGAPRDMQLGADPKDLDVVVKGGITAGIDFANWATKELGNFKEGSNPVVYPTYGTAKFTLRGVTYKGHDLSEIDIECVAPRKEKYTPGNRKPEVSGGELEDDVKRRDFTVNSLLHDLTTGETLDLTGMGKEDIKAGIVRTPLEPDIIFGEDPLRILRAVRFTAKYNWKLPMFMLKAIKKNEANLSTISKERIHDETNKMLLTKYPYKAFRLLQILKLIRHVFPSLESSNLKHMQLMEKLPSELIIRLIAALRPVNPDNVQREMSNLRYSADTIKAVTGTLRLLPTFLSKANNLDNDYLRTLAHDYFSYVPHLFAYTKVYMPTTPMKDAEERYNILHQELKANPIPITGSDLIAMGMKPGPEFKNILSKVKQTYLKNPHTPKEEYLNIIKSKN